MNYNIDQRAVSVQSQGITQPPKVLSTWPVSNITVQSICAYSLLKQVFSIWSKHIRFNYLDDDEENKFLYRNDLQTFSLSRLNEDRRSSFRERSSLFQILVIRKF